ncbi:hypothetical protein TNCT_395291 [Trichonephila clavata]|uniref:Uncharacterized protein n=1 Tax=Trichonephila clavata TaxID=2740835 RepID=A0A8X6L7P9_TRICU|nr:hypothetical protein TNCT_395291 [Trichonephila clavata]
MDYCVACQRGAEDLDPLSLFFLAPSLLFRKKNDGRHVTYRVRELANFPIAWLEPMFANKAWISSLAVLSMSVWFEIQDFRLRARCFSKGSCAV